MKFGTDIHVPQRMDLTGFCDPVAFHLAHPGGQTFNSSVTLVYDQILKKLKTNQQPQLYFVLISTC